LICSVSIICVYCKRNLALSDFNKEHVIPEGFGEFIGLDPLIQKVCKECNSSFSPLEGQMLNYGPEGFFRKVFGIKGKRSHSKRPENIPFYEPGYKSPPIEVKGKAPGYNFDLLWEPKKGGIRNSKQVVFQDNSNGGYILIPIGNKIRLSTDIKTYLKEKGISQYQLITAASTKEEREEVERLITPFLSDKTKITWDDNPPEGNKVFIHAQSTVTNAYLRAIAKIGFNYFLLQFHEKHTGLENEFDKLRQFIRFGGRSDNIISQMKEQIVYDFARGETAIDIGHLICIEMNYYYIKAYVQLFVGQEYLPKVWQIIIGRNPTRIYLENESIGHHFVYSNGFDKKGEMLKLRTSGRKLVPSFLFKPPFNI